MLHIPMFLIIGQRENIGYHDWKHAMIKAMRFGEAQRYNNQPGNSQFNNLTLVGNIVVKVVVFF